MSDKTDIDNPAPISGQFLFALLFLILSLVLLAQIGEQTKWTGWKKFWDQSRFWPAIGLGGMVFFTAAKLALMKPKRIVGGDLAEAGIWIRALEFLGWFLVYVWLVPLAGYLPVTVVFMLLLLLRVGYRTRGILWAGIILGVVTVLLFKAFLQVKIPGAVVYEYLPGALRNFFILNF